MQEGQEDKQTIRTTSFILKILSQIKSWLDVVAISQLATAIATLFLSLYTFNLWKSTDQLLQATQKQTELNELQLEVARKTQQYQERLQRPVMAWAGSNITYTTSTNKRTGAVVNLFIRTFKVDMKNLGQTSAYHVRMWADYRVVPIQNKNIMIDNSLLKDEFFLIQKPSNDGQFLAAGQDTNTLVFSMLESTNEDYIRIKNGGFALVNWGLIQYVDINGSKHWTRFCNYYLTVEATDAISCGQYDDADV